VTRFLLLACLIFPFAARAEETVAGDDDDFFSTTDQPRGNNAGVPDASAFNATPDDIDIPVQAAIKVEPPKAEAPKGPVNRIPLDLAGKTPLADNWNPQVVITDVDSVVIELPVLYANAGAGFDGATYWLIAEVYSDGVKVSESRTQVSKDTVSAKGPSVQFFRMFAPVPAKTGVLEVKVSKLASAASAKPSLLISRSINYALPG
jgi:hypothetical protein